MSDLVKCAACRKEKPVHEMKTCMHHQMHRYVCDAKCMHDFYNPFEKPASEIAQLRTANQRLEGEVKRLRKLMRKARKHLQLHAEEHGHPGQLKLIAEIKAALSTNGEVTE